MHLDIGESVYVDSEVLLGEGRGWCPMTDKGVVLDVDGQVVRVRLEGGEMYMTNIEWVRKGAEEVSIGDGLYVDLETSADGGKTYSRTLEHCVVSAVDLDQMTATVDISGESYTTPIEHLTKSNPPLPPRTLNHTGTWSDSASNHLITVAHGKSRYEVSPHGKHLRKKAFTLGISGDGEMLPNGEVHTSVKTADGWTEQQTYTCRGDTLEVRTRVVDKTGKVTDMRSAVYRREGKAEASNEVPEPSLPPGRCDIPLSRLRIIDGILSRVEDPGAWLRFLSSVSASVSSSYRKVAEAAAGSGVYSLTEQLPALLKLCAAAQYSPLTQAQWDHGVLHRGSRSRKRLLPLIDLTVSPTISEYFRRHVYQWDEAIDSERSRPTPDFADKAVIMVRGRSTAAEEFCPLTWVEHALKGRLWSPGVEVTYENVVVAWPDPVHKGKRLVLECYQDVEDSNIALLLPNKGIKMATIDTASFLSGLLPVVFFIAVGCHSVVHETHSEGSHWILVSFLVACAVKLASLILALSVISTTLHGLHSDWRSQHRRCAGSTVIHQLASHAEEQEAKEVIIAYYILSTADTRHLSLEDAQAASSSFLSSLGVASSLEAPDAFNKLCALGLATSEYPSTYCRLATPEAYLARQHSSWGAALAHHFDEIIDRRIA
eukprot:TRINITY_DN21101_c0_g1_i1.p1 TRINITY_DN21101_c0_g1~~TRINITY_DN21101_c0_g1_i1.p1  ORF type:complete len:666 (+),score=105.26 TRINITY_DN21101_c0_g1_i1:29-1999(+)